MKRIWILSLMLTLGACQKEKTAWVDTEALFEAYTPLVEAKEKYAEKNEQILRELELKIQAYSIKEKNFIANEKTYSKKKRDEKLTELRTEAQALQQERNTRMGQLQVASQRAIDSLIRMVKEEIQLYGAAQGYQYIYGQNDAGSILYGTATKNITQDLLQELNK